MSWTFTGNRPIFRQVEDYIKHDIREGVLQRGAAMPEYRMLAANLALSPAAVLRAYENLTAEGVLISDGLSHYSVAEGLQDTQLADSLDPAVTRATADFCSAMLGFGIPKKQIIDIVCAELMKYNKPQSAQTEDDK